MSKVTIETAKRVIPTTPNLYGIFLEDINRAVDGGLYPEMLRNRTFEDSIPPIDCTVEDNGYAIITDSGWRDEFNHGEGLNRWVQQNEIPYTPIPAWYSQQATMELDFNDKLNIHRQVSLFVKFKQDGRISNIGYCGIPQIKGNSYNFMMFAKVEKPIDLMISIKEGDRTYCHKELRVESNEYNQYKFTFTANSSTRNARFEIKSLQEGSIRIGYISLMPSETYLGHGLRKDLVEKLRDLNPKFYRFPGGCIVEGISPSTVMRFRNTIGPVWERPGQLLMWHYRTYNGLGFHECLQLCEDLQMEPLYVVNCGMTCQARNSVLFQGEELDEKIQDTLDAIEYAVGPVESSWGGLRAKNGHPKPFQINYIEIGNENWGPDYEERYMRLYNTIKRQYPWIQCIANSHIEKKGLPTDIVDEHYYETAEFFAEHANLYDQYNRQDPKIFLGEVAVIRGYVGQLYGALGEAAFFTGVEKNQDVVALASYAPLMENVNYQAWFPNLIRFNNKESFGIPSYYVWKLFGNHRGDWIVQSKTESKRIYRPLRGMASLMGTSGVYFQNPCWNGEQVEISHELMGRVVKQEEGFLVREADEEQKEDSKRFREFDPNQIFVIFGAEEEAKGTFEIDVKTKQNREIILGIFSSRMAKQVYVSDETNPPKEWNIENVKPFLWKIRDGISYIEEQGYPSNKMLDEEKSVVLKEGYNHLSYTNNGVQLTLLLNGEMIHNIELPYFDSLYSVVSDTNDSIIIKLVNLTSGVDEVQIICDCDVEDNYKVYYMTGDKEAENTFQQPELIYDKEEYKEGAAREFTYIAPPYSVNVLVLKKTESLRRGIRRDANQE